MKARKSKRAPQNPPPDREANSTKLREALDCIQRKDFARGLGQLDKLAGQNPSREWNAKILSAVGDSQLSRFDDAAALAAFQKSEALTAGDSRAWLRPAIGQLRVYFQNGQYEAAEARANRIFDHGIAEENAHQQQLAQAALAHSLGQVASFKNLPHRISAIGSRLGYLFLENGFPETAEAFFRKAIEKNPNGAATSRLGLAHIAMRQHAWPDAQHRALEAMKIGAYRRKTLPAIALYLQASHAAGLAPAVDALLSGYRNAPQSVRDRASFSIITGLRTARNPRWATIARDWLRTGKDKILETEVRKLLLAESKLHPASQHTANARALLASGNLRFSEWSFAARELVKADPANPVEAQALGAQAVQRFGAPYQCLAMHRLARAAMESGQIAAAKSIATEAYAQASPGQLGWSKLAWLCAQLEEKSGNLPGAATYCYAIHAEPTVPKRYQLIGLIGWARNSMRAGQLAPIAARAKEFQAATASIQDYSLLIDTARLLVEAPPELNAMAPDLLERGKKLALTIIRQSKDAAQARRAWFTLSRRLADFRKDRDILELWESFTPDFREWLWSHDDSFWEGIEYIIRSYRHLKQNDKALALAQEYLGDASTPANGIARLANQTALIEIKRRNYDRAFQSFSLTIQAAPTHVMTAYAYYWQAIRSYATGDIAASAATAAQIVSCLGKAPGLFWQQSLRIRGVLLEQKLAISPASAALGNLPLERLQEELNTINKDIRLLAA